MLESLVYVLKKNVFLSVPQKLMLANFCYHIAHCTFRGNAEEIVVHLLRVKPPTVDGSTYTYNPYIFVRNIVQTTVSKTIHTFISRTLNYKQFLFLLTMKISSAVVHSTVGSFTYSRWFHQRHQLFSISSFKYWTNEACFNQSSWFLIT